MDTLKGIPILSAMSDEQLEDFAKRCTWRNYEAGELIIDHQEDSNDVRFIISGSVRIVMRMIEGREVIFNDFDTGSFFGEVSAIDGGTRSANVSAITRTRLCVMPQAIFKQLCIEVPEIGWNVMIHLANMVRILSDRLSEFTFLKAKHRLYAELLRLSKKRANNPDQRIISPTPPQAEIADRISSRREIVSREMKTLEREGLLSRERGGLVLLEPERLSNLAAEGWLGSAQ